MYIAPVMRVVIVCSLSEWSSRKAGRHKAFFGHLAHRIVRTLGTNATVLHAGKGHQVDAAARWFVDVNHTDVNAPRQVERAHDIAREDTAGQTERRGVDLVDRIVKFVERH